MTNAQTYRGYDIEHRGHDHYDRGVYDIYNPDGDYRASIPVYENVINWIDRDAKIFYKDKDGEGFKL